MIRYLTGASNAAAMAVCHAYDIGLMIQPGNGYRHQIRQWPYWACDNACFAQGERFDLDLFLTFVATLGADRASCIFVVAPDVIQNAEATTERSLPVLPQIRNMGFPAAYVAQNGLTAATTPWQAFDVLFLGGDDAFKLGPVAADLVREARLRGKPIHMGRVNSYKRLKAADELGCTSADGTFLKFGPKVNLPRLLGWLDRLRAQEAA